MQKTNNCVAYWSWVSVVLYRCTIWEYIYIYIPWSNHLGWTLQIIFIYLYGGTVCGVLDILHNEYQLHTESHNTQNKQFAAYALHIPFGPNKDQPQFCITLVGWRLDPSLVAMACKSVKQLVMEQIEFVNVMKTAGQHSEADTLHSLTRMEA